MGKRKSIHTVPNKSGSGWANVEDGTVVSTHRRKDTAVQRGRAIARASRAEHVIHNRNGQIGRSNSYGGDPNPPKDKNR